MPDFASLHKQMMDGFQDIPRAAALVLCLAALIFLFGGTFIRRGLVLLNFGAVGALLGYGFAPRLGSNVLLAMWAGAMVMMAISYPVPRASAAAISFGVAAFTSIDLCVLAKLSPALAVVAAALLALSAAGSSLVVPYVILAAVLSLEGSILLLAGSFNAAPAFHLDGFPLYNMIDKKPYALPLCILIPAAIGFCLQLAFYDPTVKERPT